jgi:hypothetical protein
VLADAARKALLARLEDADIDVDTFLRHVESYIKIEATRRSGPNVAAAQALHSAAFPRGLEPVDEYIPDENRLCRDSIAVLRSPEHAPTVIAIKLPEAWIPSWEAALDESDAAFDALSRSRTSKSVHVGGGQDAEDDFVDAAIRLRKHVESRASRNDKAKIAEGKELLAPLLDALKKARTEERARATRRESAEASALAPAEDAPEPPAAGEPS